MGFGSFFKKAVKTVVNPVKATKTVFKATKKVAKAVDPIRNTKKLFNSIGKRPGGATYAYDSGGGDDGSAAAQQAAIQQQYKAQQAQQEQADRKNYNMNKADTSDIPGLGYEATTANPTQLTQLGGSFGLGDVNVAGKLKRKKLGGE